MWNITGNNKKLQELKNSCKILLLIYIDLQQIIKKIKEFGVKLYIHFLPFGFYIFFIYIYIIILLYNLLIHIELERKTYYIFI